MINSKPFFVCITFITDVNGVRFCEGISALWNTFQVKWMFSFLKRYKNTFTRWTNDSCKRNQVIKNIRVELKRLYAVVSLHASQTFSCTTAVVKFATNDSKYETFFSTYIKKGRLFCSPKIMLCLFPFIGLSILIFQFAVRTGTDETRRHTSRSEPSSDQGCIWDLCFFFYCNFNQALYKAPWW